MLFRSDVQEEFGYFSEETVAYLSSILLIPESEILGVLTFYTQFKLNKPGKNIIRVCHGTACHINGVQTIQEKLEMMLGIKNNETTEDGLFTIEEVACLGCCSLAPVMMINDTTYGKLTDDKLESIIKKYKEEQADN